MTEKIFYEKSGIKITQARFVVDGQTFSLANITSVKTAQKKTSIVGPLLLGFFGLAGVMGGSDSMGFGIFMLAIAVFWGYNKMQPEYHVVLNTSGGENQAYSSSNKDEILSIVDALNDAIVERG